MGLGIDTGPFGLFLTEGHTVGALILGGIPFVSTNQNALQRAVVSFVAVMCALMDSTFDALICIAVHALILLFSVMLLVYPLVLISYLVLSTVNNLG